MCAFYRASKWGFLPLWFDRANYCYNWNVSSYGVVWLSAFFRRRFPTPLVPSVAKPLCYLILYSVFKSCSNSCSREDLHSISKLQSPDWERYIYVCVCIFRPHFTTLNKHSLPTMHSKAHIIVCQKNLRQSPFFDNLPDDYSLCHHLPWRNIRPMQCY